MKSLKLYESLDRELEKLSILWSIEEGIYGLYELIQDLNRYQFLTIVDKYSIVYDLLPAILTEELAILEEFTDSQLTIKIKDVNLVDMTLILDNPRSWDLNAQPNYSLSLTPKGEQYLTNQDPKIISRLEDRFRI